MAVDWGFALIVAATSLATALVALMLLPLLPRRGALHAEAGGMVFLFDDERLIDATPEGRHFLSGGPAGLSDWQRFCALVVPRFPGFAERMGRLAQEGSALLTEAGGEAQLTATWLDGVARLTLHLPREGDGVGPPDAQSLAAMTSELATLRDVVEAMPTPAWQQDSEGAVAWANGAYLKLVQACQPDGAPLSWPLPALFSTAGAEPLAPRREALRLADGTERWFDRLTADGRGNKVHFVLPADETVRAETALRNFVQTLTTTFAELPIGLAVFNRARELVLFNPAMSDLFELEPEFLTARPTLLAVLDRLRETRMMPEPKDYRSWREQILRLERDAQDGVYSDTWTLPGGQVYRVTGRPHPDGAVAFLFEDISAEMSLTRRFRGEIETGQAVLDSLDEAIAVFTSAGVLSMSNIAYAELWGDDPMLVMATTDIGGATTRWYDQCLPDGDGNASEMARRIRTRETWTGTLVHRDGRRLSCRVRPIAGGAILVGFVTVALDEAAPRAVSGAAR